MTRTGLAVSEKQTFIRLNHLRVWGFLLQLLALNTLISSPSLFLHSIITLFMHLCHKSIIHNSQKMEATPVSTMNGPKKYGTPIQ